MWSINHDRPYLKIGHSIVGEFREPVCVVPGYASIRLQATDVGLSSSSCPLGFRYSVVVVVVERTFVSEICCS